MYEKATVAESIKLVMLKKNKPWLLAEGEGDDNIGEIGYSASHQSPQ